MPMGPCKVTFHLDGSGVLFDPNEPLHLDGLLSWACRRHHPVGEAPTRDGRPDDIPLPVSRWRVGETWGWCCSALFPDGPMGESIQYWRKKFRVGRLHLSDGAPNLTNATYREWNMPIQLLLMPRMVAWAHGDVYEIRRELRRNVRHVGRKGAMGKGVVNDITVERCEEDWSLVRDGLAQRWLPDPDGSRLVRPRPPYWNRHERIYTCEVGDEYDAAHLSC